MQDVQLSASLSLSLILCVWEVSPIDDYIYLRDTLLCSLCTVPWDEGGVERERAG